MISLHLIFLSYLAQLTTKRLDKSDAYEFELAKLCAKDEPIVSWRTAMDRTSWI